MAELEQWTQSHDDTLREALALMRRDVEALPLADVRFVKARGNARRRRTQLVGVASAAAVVAIGFMGFHSIGDNRALQVGPAATSPTTASNLPTANPTATIAAPGPLLVAAEWRYALGIAGSVQLGELAGEGVSTCVGSPGAQIVSGYASTGPSEFYGVQGTYRATSPAAGNAAAAKAVSQLIGPACHQLRENYKAEADAAWPKVFSNATADGKSWFVVAHQGALTTLVGLSDPILGDSKAANPHFSLAQIQALALLAQQHLVQELEHPATPK